MNTLDQTYHAALKPLYNQIPTLSGLNSTNVDLAQALINSAVVYDKRLVEAVTAMPYDKHIQRNFENPPNYTSPFILHQSWSDHPETPLHGNEQWNSGRRGCNTGIHYNLDAQNHPINPYYNYGVQGRGVIGLYGPNHAVDNGALRIQTNAHNQPALFALGIIRKDNGLPALCGGFTQFIEYNNNSYPYTQQVKIQSQSLEFFEEIISGSIILMDKYKEGLDDMIFSHIRHREKSQGCISQKEQEMIIDELTTARKVQQVNVEDPLFMCRLRHAFREATPCYEGPVLSSIRNTNTSWMETKLSYFVMDEKKWQEIKGEDKFGYNLMAGDDAGKALWHEITPQLMEKAGSHSAFFAYLLAGFLLTNPPEDPSVLASIQNQARGINTFLRKEADLPPPLIYSV